MNKSLLYISYYFPPIKSIAVKRNYYFAYGLKEYFEEVQVLTTSNSDLLDQESYPLDGLKVNKLPTFDYRTIMSKFKRKKTTHFSELHKRSWIISFLIKLNETFPFNLMFGEGGFLFIYKGYVEGRKYLLKQDVKYIITSYRPFANVFIGFLLKKTFKDAVWIVNFHDFPIDKIRNNVFIPSFQKWIWKEMLKLTSHNISVSNGVENHIKQLTPHITTVMNGVVLRPSLGTIKTKFRLVYTGSLYQNLSNPEILFKCLFNLIQNGLIQEDTIEIVYAGKDSKYWSSIIKKNGLEKLAKDLSEISSKEAMEIQSTANVNILLTWATKNQSGIITGKFYEYLGSTKPILAIINGIMDEEFYLLFKDLNCGTVVATKEKNAENQINEFLMHTYHAWKNNINIPPYIENLKYLNWEHQIKKLSEIILR